VLHTVLSSLISLGASLSVPLRTLASTSLTSFRRGGAKGLQTSVVTFDITQFFPSLNHEVLLEVISRLVFPMEMGPFFRLYLVGRRTTYHWDVFTSDLFVADVGVGQGSALSPVLSALYLTLITRLFHASDIGHQVGLMSYVDDGTIIAQSARVEGNLALLKEAYGWLFRAFTALGLVLEHDKSEAFHFLHARSFEGPAVDLGYAPFTGDTPLRPKAIWRYLGFFFNCKLQFKKHACFYTTRAFTIFIFFIFNQQFITRCSIAVCGKPYKKEYSLRVYTCKIVRDITALTLPFRAVMSPARAKRGQENDKEKWALRRLPKPALAPDGRPPQHAQSTPKDVPSRSQTCVYLAT
jgi:hypothetical protein